MGNDPGTKFREGPDTKALVAETEPKRGDEARRVLPSWVGTSNAGKVLREYKLLDWVPIYVLGAVMAGNEVSIFSVVTGSVIDAATFVATTSPTGLPDFSSSVPGSLISMHLGRVARTS